MHCEIGERLRFVLFRLLQPLVDNLGIGPVFSRERREEITKVCTKVNSNTNKSVIVFFE